MSEVSFEMRQAQARVRLIRYLVSIADARGLTHGEKHYILQDALREIVALQKQMDDPTFSWIERNQKTEVPDISDIPF